MCRPLLEPEQEISFLRASAPDCSYTRHVTNAAARRLGILGGTFDPPHAGHVAAALAAQTQVGLDEVILMVANEPWQKVGDRQVTPAQLRWEMTGALVQGISGLRADDREIRRGGPTFTVDTLEEILAEQPDTEIFLIVGADTAERLETWHRVLDVVRLSTIVIVNRDNSTNSAPGFLREARVLNVTMNPVDVSSSAIREAFSRGESIEAATSPSVTSIIRDRSLYVGIQ
ncbi:MAG: nicotinate (nicotinamide) nucleotide adenylyltransferase [Ilumatobacteraceae bacterium]|nr:nicotinate (nicotinamide) nucleotide adenylyltransferase [Ilumatobacteraceae bacterium]